MGRFFLAMVALVALMLFFSWYGKATPKQRNDSLRNIVVYGVGGGLILLVVTGRIPWLFAAVGALMPIIQRAIMAKRLWGLFKSTRGLGTTGSAGAGSNSRLDTRFLAMILDHDSGRLDGEILSGRFSGQSLSSLELEQLLLLMQDYKSQDVQSASVLEAFLDRQFADWRANYQETKGEDASHDSANSDLTLNQAYQILGIEPGADAESVGEAHKRLIQKLHPDRGGSDFLASQVNRAKDIVLASTED